MDLTNARRGYPRDTHYWQYPFKVGIVHPDDGLPPAPHSALSLPRLLHAFFDPVVGSWSDNSRGRGGWRRPFIFAGAIGLAVTWRYCGCRRRE